MREQLHPDHLDEDVKKEGIIIGDDRRSSLVPFPEGINIDDALTAILLLNPPSLTAVKVAAIEDPWKKAGDRIVERDGKIYISIPSYDYAETVGLKRALRRALDMMRNSDITRKRMTELLKSPSKIPPVPLFEKVSPASDTSSKTLILPKG